MPANGSLLCTESLEAFQRTEAFEWAKRKGNPNACIPSLQAFKLMYAINIADYGYSELALSYVKSVKTLIERSGGSGKYSESFINALDVFEDRVAVSLERGGTMDQKEERKKSIFGSLGSGLKKFSISGLASGIVSAAAGDDGRMRSREAGESMYGNGGGVGDVALQQQQQQMQAQQKAEEQRMWEEQAARDRAELFGGDVQGQRSEVKVSEDRGRCEATTEGGRSEATTEGGRSEATTEGLPARCNGCGGPNNSLTLNPVADRERTPDASK